MKMLLLLGTMVQLLDLRNFKLSIITVKLELISTFNSRNTLATSQQLCSSNSNHITNIELTINYLNTIIQNYRPNY